MKKKSFLTVTVLVIVALIATVFTGCGKSSQGGATGAQELTYNLATEPKTIDPTLAEANDNAICVQQAFEGLTKMDSKGNVIKGAASDWKVSSDNLTYTFTIRKDAKWSDGQPVKAGDFVYSWKRALDPKLAATYAYLLTDNIKGALEYNSGKGTWDNVGIKATDDSTVQITLKAPNLVFTQLLTMPIFVPLREDIVSKNPDNWTQDPKTYIGNGPFKMVSWTHNDSLVWAKNTNYHDAKNVKLTKLTFFMVVDQATALSSFDKGEIDYMNDLPTSDIPRLTKSKEFSTVPLFGTYYFMFNSKKAPFDNPKVREALTLAVNRTDLVKNVTKAGEVAATAFVPFGYNETKSGPDFRKKGGDWYKPEGDIAKAKQLLADAGYPDGKGFPAVTYTYNTSDNHKLVAEYLQDQWKKNLGINVKIINQEWNVFQDARKAGNYDIARGGWTADYVDPTDFLCIFTTGNGFNDPKYSNAQFDTLYQTAVHETDNAKRNTEMHQAEDLLKADLPISPLYFYVNKVVSKTYVKGAFTTVLGTVSFENAYVQK